MITNNFPFIADPELIHQLRQRATCSIHAPGEILFHQDSEPEAIYILGKGTVTLTTRTADRVIPLATAGTGSLLGLGAVLAKGQYPATAEILEEAEIYMVATEDLASFMQAHPPLSLRLLKILAAEIQTLNNTVLAKKHFNEFSN